MQTQDIRAVIRTSLLAVFLVSLVVGTGGFYLILREQALGDAAQQARLLLASAVGVRRYTDDRIGPLTTKLPADSFHEESVPSFAAQTIFGSVSATEHAFTYREAALNPTDTSDRATAFEAELIQRFRQEPGLKEVSGDRAMGGERVFYLARPIRITDRQCLACHDKPQGAPPAMLAKYGSSNGFGWTLGETVGVQWLALPVTLQFQRTLLLAGLLAAGLTAIFALAYFALSMALHRAVSQPLQALSAAADAASRGAPSPPDPAPGAAREIRDLAGAIRRLTISVGKLMAEAVRGAPPA